MKKTSKFLTTVALSAVIPMAIQCPILATNEKTQIEQGAIAPELRILENQSIGKNGVYSKLVLETTDTDGDLDYYLINGYAQSTIPEENKYKNSRTFIEGHIKEGENKIKVFDKAGNCSNEITFIADYTKPLVKSANLYSNVPANVTTYYVNEGKTIVANIKTNEELGSNPIFTFHNNGKDYIVESEARGIESHGYYEYSASLKTTELTDGEITFTASQIADTAGNKVDDVTKVTNANKVIVDKTAPQCTGLRIIGAKHNKSNNTWYVKNNDYIQVYVKFDEDLKTSPVLKIEGIEKEITLNKYENTSEYGIRMQITGNDKIKDGEMKLTISGYTDKAGNEGKTLTNDDIKGLTSQSRIVIDRTAPKITVKENTQNEIFTVKNKDGETYSKISFKLYDAQKIEKIVINAQEKMLTPNEYSDHNYVAIGKNYGIQGKNIITLYDIAGNMTTYEFYLEEEKEDEEIKKPEEDENKKPSEDNKHHYCKNICCYIKHQICIIEKIIFNIFGRRI